MSVLCKEAQAAGPGERGGASPLAGKVSSALYSVEKEAEQITSRASCSGGAGVVHLMKTLRIRMGTEKKKSCPHLPEESEDRVLLQRPHFSRPRDVVSGHPLCRARSENPGREGRRREGMGVWQEA